MKYESDSKIINGFGHSLHMFEPRSIKVRREGLKELVKRVSLTEQVGGGGSKCIFAKCTRLACLLNFAGLFFEERVPKRVV